MIISDQTSPKIYLIKSASRILGPFDQIQIVEMIQRHEISAIDEIRSPHQRWIYIRDHAQFNDIWKETLKGISDSNSKSQSKTNSILQKTQELIFNEGAHLDAKVENNNTSEKLVNDKQGVVKREPAADLNSKDINFIDPKFSVQKKSFNYKWIIVIVLIGIIMLGVFEYFKFEKQNAINSSINELELNSKKYFSLKLYNKALVYYKQLVQIKKPDILHQLDMNFVLMELERQTFSVREVFNEYIKQPNSKRELIVKSYNGLGLSYSYDEDLTKAYEYFEKGLSFEPENVNIRTNIGFLKLRQNLFYESYLKFKEISVRDNPFVLMGQIISLNEYIKANKETWKNQISSDEIENLLNEIQNYELKKINFNYELWILKSYFFFMTQQNEKFEIQLTKMNKLIYNTVNLFASNIEVDKIFIRWDFLDKYCQEIYNKSAKSEQISFIRIQCLINIGQLDEAKKKLDELVMLFPKSNYISSANLAYYNGLGLQSEFESERKLKTSSKLLSDKLLIFNHCIEKKNIECINENIQQIVAVDQNSIYTFYLKARASYLQGKFEETIVNIKLSEELENNFLPLIDLKLLIEESRK